MPSDNQVLDAVMDRVIAGALESLKPNISLASLVHNDFSSDIAAKGDSIDVFQPYPLEAQPVIPGAYSQDTQNIAPEPVSLKLNYWDEVAFYLSDRELAAIYEGLPAVQAAEALKTLYLSVNTSIAREAYRAAYTVVGAIGSPLFAGTIAPAQEARKLLNLAYCPMLDRRLVLDVNAEANAVALPEFMHADKSGGRETIVEGEIGRKLGFDWYYDQTLPTHTAGSASGYLINQTNHAAQVTETIVDTGTGTILPGDIFTVAGSAQTYTVKSFANNVISYAPKSVSAFANNAALTFRPSHGINLAFHRDAIAIAVRSLNQNQFELNLGGRSQIIADANTGISVRLEVRREHKRLRWSFDCLWGVKAVRPEHIIRLVS